MTGSRAWDAHESVADLRARARAWLAENFRHLEPGEDPHAGYDDTELSRSLMRELYEAGFAGICFPSEYGGRGLSFEHLQAFSEEAQGYELPYLFNLPSMGIIAATLLEFGTEEQKRRHVPAILRGDELWVQFLSEPTGGSDLAGAITRATRDGDAYILNGAKIWSSGAHRADFALCLCRTDWDAPKHRGLSWLIVEIRQPGIQVDQIRHLNGSMNFCQEFFDDVPIPVANLVGGENDGWTVATHLLSHEKLAVGGGSQYVLVTGDPSGEKLEGEDRLVTLARESARQSDPRVRQLVADGRVHDLVNAALVDRITQGLEVGHFSPQASALLRLAAANTSIHRAELAAKIAGPSVAAWHEGDGAASAAVQFLSRQSTAIGGGTTEIARNVISERVLGMPREHAADRDIPFREVSHNRNTRRRDHDTDRDGR